MVSLFCQNKQIQYRLWCKFKKKTRKLVFYIKLITNYIFLADPFQDLISELGKTEENSSHILISDDYEQTSNLSTTKITTTTTTPEPTTTIPKSCPAPDVTYNGSLLSTVQATFKVEFI